MVNKLGTKLTIHGYKHNGELYRTWDEAVLLDETDDFIVVGNDNTTVSNSDGRIRQTNEPAVIYFFKNKWFNVVGQLKKKGICYYCNLASPYIIEDNIIKYIDYDLDLRVFPDRTYRILDRAEYRLHKVEMNYSDDLDKVVNYEFEQLINLFKSNNEPFDNEIINKYHLVYTELLNKGK